MTRWLVLSSLSCAVAAAGCDSHIGFEGRHAEEWIELLGSRDTTQQQRAAFALGQILTQNPKEQGVLPALLRAVSDTNDGVRMVAARALSQAERGHLPGEAVPGVIRALHDSAHADVRAQAADLLGHVPAEWSTRVARELAAALSDPDASVRAAAANGLEHMGPPAAPAAPALRRAVRDDHDYVRSNALMALRALELPDPEAHLPLFRETLRDRSPIVRANAAYALATLGEAAAPAVGDLLGALDDPAAEVRRAAASALGHVGVAARAAAPALRRRLTDPDAGVRRAARETLAGLGVTDGA